MASQLIHNLDLSMSIHNLGLVDFRFGFWAPNHIARIFMSSYITFFFSTFIHFEYYVVVFYSNKLV